MNGKEPQRALPAVPAGLAPWVALLAGLVAMLCCPLAAVAKTGPENGADRGRSRGLRYQVAFEGVEDKGLLDLLQAVSTAASQSGQPVASIFLLRGRVRADGPRLLAALKSQGRFAARVSSAVDESVSPVMVRFTVGSAEPFILERVAVELAEDSPPVGFPLPDAHDLGLTVGGPAFSKDIASAKTTLLDVFMNHGHPFPVLARQRVVADFQARTVQVIFVVTPGPHAFFGPTVFTGLKDVKRSFAESFITWREGEEYKHAQVLQLRQKLLDLGLFATVAAGPEKALDSKGRAVVAVSVTERKQRTIKAGVTYKTDEGPGVNVLWEHRNLMGQGEKLRLNLAASAINKTFEATFEKPQFYTPNQQFLAAFKASDENTPAYQGQNLSAQAGLGRALTDTLKINAGVGYRGSRIQNDEANPQENNKRWQLAFVPLELLWNTRDDILNPKKGLLLGVKAAPYLDTLGRNLSFIKAEISAAHYLRLLATPELILALRASLGSISGAQAKDIPPDVRFYAGGSASVRGYGYQLAGPLRGNKPLGGDSLFDFGSELRLQVTSLVGVVAFLDGGNAYTQSFPALEQGVLLGAGLGLRITTPIAPLRVDAAVPLQRRPGVDDQFQFYVSLGQAF